MKRSHDVDETQKLKDKKAHIDLTSDDDPEPQMTDDDNFSIIPFAEISLVEPRFEINSSKSRDSTSDTQHQAACNIKISESQSLNSFGSFDFGNEQNLLVEVASKSSNVVPEIPNEVPSSGSNITMLSSTSLLHGNCVFNRNNTVATQAGLKTYWLCKSYRISMCKARCITHQVRFASASYHASLIKINSFREKWYRPLAFITIYLIWTTNLRKFRLVTHQTFSIRAILRMIICRTLIPFNPISRSIRHQTIISIRIHTWLIITPTSLWILDNVTTYKAHRRWLTSNCLIRQLRDHRRAKTIKYNVKWNTFSLVQSTKKCKTFNFI